MSVEKKKSFIMSKAKWPKGTIEIEEVDDVTEFEHLTRGQARSMCHVLNIHGFRSGKKVFPIHTWIECEGKKCEDVKSTRRSS